MTSTPLTLKVEMLSYWHVGSGVGQGKILDALTIKDEMGFPFVPGKSLKGLVREAFQTAADSGHVAPGRVDELFGTEGSSTPGLLRFNNVVLPEKMRTKISELQGVKTLFRPVPATAIDEFGTAADKTLRTVEVVIPMQLFTQISAEDNGGWIQDVASFCGLVRNLGKRRKSGFGRCRLTTIIR